MILGNLTEYFSKYGEIESVDLKKDNVTQKSRGFGFVTFKDAQALDLVSSSFMSFSYISRQGLLKTNSLFHITNSSDPFCYNI